MSALSLLINLLSRNLLELTLVEKIDVFEQQFPLTTRSMVALQRADPLDRDESIALAMDEERYKGDASVTQPESGRQQELMVFEQVY